MQTLTESYHNQAHEYRVALQREVQHVKRIFPTITPDVHKVLLQALKEIPVPPLGQHDADAMTLLTTPKPNFVKIAREVVAEI